MKLLNENTGLGKKEFECIFNDYFERIKNFIFYRCGNIELAEDLSQDVFVKLWEHRENVKIETVNSYIYSIANNLFNNEFNRSKVRLNFINNRLDSDKNAESPEFLAELKEFDLKLQNTINEIPEKSRTVFLMNRIDELTYKEIASSLGISVKAVEKRMSKAIAHMQLKLNKKV